MLKAFLAVVGLLGVVACSSVDCALQKKVECKVQMVDANGQEVAFDGYLTVSIAEPTDETVKDTLLNRLDKVSSFSFPLSYAADVDILRLSFSNREENADVIDVLSIEKSNEPVFESVDCAPRFNHTISSVSCTSNIIDSVKINNKKVDNDASKVHLRIYMHTAD